MFRMTFQQSIPTSATIFERKRPTKYTVFHTYRIIILSLLVAIISSFFAASSLPAIEGKERFEPYQDLTTAVAMEFPIEELQPSTTPAPSPSESMTVRIVSAPQEYTLQVTSSTIDDREELQTRPPSMQPLHLELPVATYRSISTFFSAGHPGVDLTDPAGTPVRAAESGSVKTAGWTNDGYGLLVRIQHANAVMTLYAHLSSIAVTIGQEVEKGQLIGTVGCTGNCTGNHLHYEVHMNGQAINPL